MSFYNSTVPPICINRPYLKLHGGNIDHRAELCDRRGQHVHLISIAEDSHEFVVARKYASLKYSVRKVQYTTMLQYTRGILLTCMPSTAVAVTLVLDGDNGSGGDGSIDADLRLFIACTTT